MWVALKGLKDPLLARELAVQDFSTLCVRGGGGVEVEHEEEIKKVNTYWRKKIRCSSMR